MTASHRTSHRGPLDRVLHVGVGAVFGIIALGAMGALLFRSCTAPWFTVQTDVGPGKGVASERLPVEVSPRVGLTDGAVVTVSSEAFAANRVVGVAVCLAAADTEAAGVDACDDVHGSRYAVTADGKLRATYAVPRVVTIGGVAHDCAAASASCLVVAADASNYDRSGGQPISFRTDLPTTDLVAVTERAGSILLPVLPPSFDGVRAGATVDVTVAGFQPGEAVVLARCAGFPQRSAIDSCEPVDGEAVNALITRDVSGISRHADATGTVRASFTILREITTFRAADGPVDCTDRAASCALVVSAGADTQRSAVVPYTVAP